MANVLWYYSTIRDKGCGCCSERVAEYELRDESGNVLDCGDDCTVVYDAKELKYFFAYMIEQYGEFEPHPDNVYL